MKIFIPKHWLGAFLGRSSTRSSTWLIIIGVILFGAYLLKNRLGLWGVLAVGIAGMLIGTGAYFLRNRTASAGTNNGRAGKSLPRIVSAWDYRPRDLRLRSSTSTPDVSAEITDAAGLSRSVLDGNTDVWFNFSSQKSDS